MRICFPLTCRDSNEVVGGAEAEGRCLSEVEPQQHDDKVEVPGKGDELAYEDAPKVHEVVDREEVDEDEEEDSDEQDASDEEEEEE